MGFRTIEIGQMAELHIKENQLEITTTDGVLYVPIEDINQIIAHGANIRLSTMDLSILSRNKVVLTTLDDKYLPTAIVLPFEGNSRQAKLMHVQADTKKERYNKLWVEIIRKKVQNQARALSILELKRNDCFNEYVDNVSETNVDGIEANVAKKYFEIYHNGLNRREDDPINSRLNYGYAVVRSYIVRSLVSAGFHPAFGIHHSNQLNLFNLADDLIEPYRPCVDILAIKNDGPDINLSKTERRNISHVLHNACIVDGIKVSIMTSIDMAVESLKRILLELSEEELKLPDVIEVESMEGISE